MLACLCRPIHLQWIELWGVVSLSPLVKPYGGQDLIDDCSHPTIRPIGCTHYHSRLAAPSPPQYIPYNLYHTAHY